MKRQWKWWVLPLAVVLVILIVSVLLWPSMKVYLAPKTVLTSALTNTYASLEQRMANSPLVLIGGALDFENGNTVALDLDTSNDLLGSVQYDMTVRTQWNPRRVFAQGQVITQGKNMDLSVYLDGDFGALSSAGLLQGNYYGLTYDTFSQDIRSNQLLSLVIGDDILHEWESQIQSLQAFMRTSWEVPELSEDDLRSILIGILALKAEVDREDILLNGREEDCFVISFETTGAAIAAGLDYLQAELPIVWNANTEVDVSFYLYQDAVVKIGLDTDAEVDAELFLGSDAATDDLIFRYQDTGNALTVTVKTQQDAAFYQETITITGANLASVSYNWDLNTGDLTLDLIREGEKRSTSGKLSDTETGFRLETGDFEALMHLLWGTKDSADSPCTMTVAKGASIVTPDYKNFSDWSLEDLATLLSGVGSLFGLEIA